MIHHKFTMTFTINTTVPLDLKMKTRNFQTHRASFEVYMGVFSLSGGFPPIDFTPQVLIIFSRKNHGPVELRFFFWHERSLSKRELQQSLRRQICVIYSIA